MMVTMTRMRKIIMIMRMRMRKIMVMMMRKRRMNLGCMIGWQRFSFTTDDDVYHYTLLLSALLLVFAIKQALRWRHFVRYNWEDFCNI